MTQLSKWNRTQTKTLLNINPFGLQLNCGNPDSPVGEGAELRRNDNQRLRRSQLVVAGLDLSLSRLT